MSKENESVHPNPTVNYYGISKLELFAKDIFCAYIGNRQIKGTEEWDCSRSMSIVQAKLLLKELEEKSNG